MSGANVSSTVEHRAKRLEQLEIPARPELPGKAIPGIFISYAWGDNSSEDARKRGEVVEQLYETLCDAANVKAPTLYHHFGDENGLLDAVVAKGLLEAFLTRMQASPVRDRITHDEQVDHSRDERNRRAGQQRWYE